MRKLMICFVVAGTMFSTAYGQASEGAIVPSEITSVRPASGYTYSFPSEEAKRTVVPVKVAELQQLIIENSDNAELVLRYRERMWSFENATIQPLTGPKQ